MLPIVSGLQAARGTGTIRLTGARAAGAMARVMLSQNDTIFYPFYNECEYSQDPGSGKWDGQNNPSLTDNNNDELQIKVYPNPSENELFIEIIGDEIIAAHFELWTILGQKAKVLSLHAGLNKIIINDMPAGLYNYAVYINNERKQSGKQIIIKQ